MGLGRVSIVVPDLVGSIPGEHWAERTDEDPICAKTMICVFGVLSMKVGDDVKIHGKPEYGRGKIVRFYAKHGTVLVQFEKEKQLF